MFTLVMSLTLFLVSYILSVTFTSVFYHRALCHKAIKLNPKLEKFIFNWGFIITAVDPLIWICTHRMHHLYTDEARDPHSPKFHKNLLQMNDAHLKAYATLNQELRDKKSGSWEIIKDLNADLHPLMKLPNIPFLGISWGNAVVYSFHLGFYVALYCAFHNFWYPLAIGLGLLGHPVQGVLVNYFGHKDGYRNFETNDASTNHQLVALLILGEGYQNNHHYSPSSAKFSVKRGEFDFGYRVCLLLRKLSLASF